MISRGGTNQYQWDVFEYLRNSALNARNFFDGPKIPQLEKNNFGGSFGGPIRKDKAFFYAVYEGLQENLGFTANDTCLRQAAHGERDNRSCLPHTRSRAGRFWWTIANADIAGLLSLPIQIQTKARIPTYLAYRRKSSVNRGQI